MSGGCKCHFVCVELYLKIERDKLKNEPFACRLAVHAPSSGSDEWHMLKSYITAGLPLAYYVSRRHGVAPPHVICPPAR